MVEAFVCEPSQSLASTESGGEGGSIGRGWLGFPGAGTTEKQGCRSHESGSCSSSARRRQRGAVSQVRKERRAADAARANESPSGKTSRNRRDGKTMLPVDRQCQSAVSS